MRSPKPVRGPAITRINDALRPGEPLVLTCRTEQYRDAVRPPLGVEVTLRAAAVVQLCPLNTDAVSRLPACRRRRPGRRGALGPCCWLPSVPMSQQGKHWLHR